MNETIPNDFQGLTTDIILDAVERHLGSTFARATGRVLRLNSLENRVLEVELEDGQSVVIKLYRPNRWSKEAILEEHSFITELEQHEIPAVGFLPNTDGATLSTLKYNDLIIYYSVMPKVRARIEHELSSEMLKIMGRHLARLHNIGATKKFQHRPTLNIQNRIQYPLQTLQKSPHAASILGQRYLQQIKRFEQEVQTRLSAYENLSLIRTHGDCHLGNTLWMGSPQNNRSGNDNTALNVFFLDFDDTVMAPAVQDIWMVIRGNDASAQAQRHELLESYEHFRSFDHREWQWIEILRGMRMIHYNAWISDRWRDQSFQNAFEGFGSESHWVSEIEALERVLESTSSLA